VSRAVRLLLVALSLSVAPAFLIAPQTAAAVSTDMAVLAFVNNSTPNVGDTVTFVDTVINGGPVGATNVSVHDALPAGLQFVSATPSVGTFNSAAGTWTVGTVVAGAVVNLQLSATVVSPNSLVNTASVTATESDPNPGNNSASATETPQRADLALTQSVDNPAPSSGQVVRFTVTLTDSGLDPATNVTVQDLLPSGLSLLAATPSQGTYSSGTGVWTVGTVSGATPQTLQIQATYIGPGPKINTASVSHSDQFDPDPTNNSSSLTVPRTATQTTVVSSANPSLFGQPVSFIATVTPAPDGGSVTFTVDGTPLGSPVAVNTTTGVATSAAISSLPVGSHQVIATYSGDANYLSSAAQALGQGVNRALVNPAPGGGRLTAAISGLKISPSAFAAASTGPSAVAAAKPSTGARVTYTLNEAASVKFTVTQSRPGRRDERRRCTQPTKRNRHAHACVRYVTLPGSFTHAGHSGRNSFRFTGRLNGHKLPPGSYELIATTSAGGHHGRPVQTAFKIVTSR
jgi:uncharacterized repeat protein (TIGR01451 family)